MGDAKLFKLGANSVTEMISSSFAIEKALQNLIEAHLGAFFGVRLLSSEFVTSKTHGGRIDSIGLDENSNPVIIEYKRSTNENVISQGLFYLDWLLEHRADFKLLVMEKLGGQVAAEIDWSSPRVVCIAADFTKYDEHAVNQMGRNIELIRYRRYGEEFLFFEMVNQPTVISNVPAKLTKSVSEVGGGPKASGKSIADRLAAATPDVQERFEKLDNYLMLLGDDVQKKVAQDYFGYRRIKNFACVEVHPQLSRITVFVNSDFADFTSEPKFSRDVRNIGHYGTGNLELSIFSDFDIDRAKPFIEKSYGGN